MITVEPTKAIVDGKEYFAELGKVVSTFLGKEDHGIFTFVLDMAFGSSHQGAGTYGLNDPEEFGTALQALINFAGPYDGWEGLRNRDFYALRDERYGLIRGLMDKTQSKALIFGDWKIIG